MRFTRTLLAISLFMFATASAAWAANIPATAYNEDTAHTDGDKATAVVGVRRDADTSPVGTDGDYQTPVFDSTGNLKVTLKGALGTSATSLGKAEDAGHSTGDTGVEILAVRNDANVLLAGTDLDYIPLSTDNTGALRVTGSVAGTQYAEDAVHVSADVGFQSLAVRNDTAASLAGASGDYLPLTTDAVGAVWANDVDLPAAGALADNTAANPTTTVISSVPLLIRNAVRGVTDRQIAVYDTMDVVGAGSGIAASGVVAQLDDTATTVPTENSWDPVRLNSRRSLYIAENSADLSITCVSAIAGGGIVCNTPAPAAGNFVYITSVHIVQYETAGAAGGAVPNACVANNWPAANIWTFNTAAAIGTFTEQSLEPNSPIKALLAATATGVTCGATASSLWRINIHYYVAA